MVDFITIMDAVREEFEGEDDMDDLFLEIAHGRSAQERLKVAEAERDVLLQVIREAKNSLLEAHARAAIKAINDGD